MHSHEHAVDLNDKHDVMDGHEYAWLNTMSLMFRCYNMFVCFCLVMFLPLDMLS